MCLRCIGDSHLRRAFREESTVGGCDFCGAQRRKTVPIELLAPVIGAAFRRHYRPGEQEPQFSDASDKVWFEQAGELPDWGVQEMATVEPEVAEAVVEWLSENDDEDSADGGTPLFDGDMKFEETRASAGEYLDKWREFEFICKHQERFFAPTLRKLLDEMFGSFKVFGESPIVTISPSAPLSIVFRARSIKAEDVAKIGEDVPSELGPPPAQHATPGRMNPGGISVFYGAFAERVAVSEMRPRKGSLLAVARFRLARTLRLLDFETFDNLAFRDSYFKPGFQARASKRAFLRLIGQTIAKPVQPHEELLDYVPTQILAEYLRVRHRLDGLIYPSAQFGDTTPESRRAAGRHSNLVLFHHAARVQDGRPLQDGSGEDRRAVSLVVDEDASRGGLDHLMVATVTDVRVDYETEWPIRRADVEEFQF